MIGIDRQAVNADPTAVAVPPDLALGRRVMVVAEGLQVADEGRIDVAVMWQHVVGDRGRRDDATRKAEPTQRMQRELQLAEVLPAQALPSGLLSTSASVAASAKQPYAIAVKEGARFSLAHLGELEVAWFG